MQLMDYPAEPFGGNMFAADNEICEDRRCMVNNRGLQGQYSAIHPPVIPFSVTGGKLKIAGRAIAGSAATTNYG